MKAVMIEKHGGPEVLKSFDNIDKPETKKNEALIKIEATSINKVDTVVRQGYPGMNIPLPHIPGGDISGTIAEIDSSETEFATGDRVIVYPIALPKERDPQFEGMEHLNNGWQYFGMHRPGSYAEYISVPVENLVKLPENVTFEQAAALPISGLTAYHATAGVAKLREGKTFFIWGGSGGMGSLAVQIAKTLGATVIATVGKNEKKSAIESIGADYVFNHYENDVKTEVMKMYPQGIDVIMDYIGPATFDKSFTMLKKNGNLLFCGMITGMEIKLNIQQTYFRHLNINGLYLGSPVEFQSMLNLYSEKMIKPLIHEVLPLEEAKRGHEMIASGEILGKVVLKV